MQRTAVFKWIGAIVLDLGREGLPPLAYQLLAPLARELVSSDESGTEKQLHQLAKQVSDLIKKKLGMEVYTRLLSRLQIKLATRRADRKKLRAQEVSDYRMEGVSISHKLVTFYTVAVPLKSNWDVCMP